MLQRRSGALAHTYVSVRNKEAISKNENERKVSIWWDTEKERGF